MGPTYPMTERDRLMGLRQFLRGGYRELTEPTTIISGTERLFVVIPEVWKAGPRPVHHEPDGASLGADRVVSPDARPQSVQSERGAEKGFPASVDGTGGQAEAPRGASEPPAGRKSSASPRPAPARRPGTQAVLDRAAKEGRTQ